MHYWRSLIPVLAVLGAVASFTERSSIDGRERRVLRRELTRVGPDQRFTIGERGYIGKSLEFDRERLDTRARVSHGNRLSTYRNHRTNSIDRQVLQEIRPTEVGHQSRILRERRRNNDDGYRSARFRAESRREVVDRQSYGSEDGKTRVHNLRNSVQKRDTERVERRMRTDLRPDSRFHVRRNDDALQSHGNDAVRRVGNERIRLNRYSDSTRQISRRTRDTGRILATQEKNKERVTAERQIRREESQNSREMTSKHNRQDIRNDHVLAARQTRGVATSDETRTRRTRTLFTRETIRDARMDGRNHYNRQSRVSARATPENTRNTGDVSTSHQVRVRFDDVRSNVDSRNARDAQTIIDQRIRSNERLFSRQSRIAESREVLRDRRARTRETPENIRLVSNRLDDNERIRNSARRGVERKYNSKRVVDFNDRRESHERRIERARSASESRTVRSHRYDGRVDNRVSSKVSVRARSEEPLTIRKMAHNGQAMSERRMKAARVSMQWEPGTNRISSHIVRNSILNPFETNETETRSPKTFKFRQEMDIHTSSMGAKDQSNKAQEYSEKHVEGAPITSGWTTLAFYSLQGIYLCALLYKMTNGKLDKNTNSGFHSWSSSPGKLIKLE